MPDPATTTAIVMALQTDAAKLLIERISDLVGGYFRPFQIVRIANADAKANIIGAQTNIDVRRLQAIAESEASRIEAIGRLEVQEIEQDGALLLEERKQRAVRRFLVEESRSQENMESIAAQAAADVKEDAKPSEIEDDWIVNFFDKCRLISDQDMQRLWAKVLCGEANQPGKFSKRTVAFLASLDKSEAMDFAKLCRFCWFFINEAIPVVFDLNETFYSDNGLTHALLRNLESIGLISMEPLTGYNMNYQTTGQVIGYPLTYFGKLWFVRTTNNNLVAGKVLFTAIGRQLLELCDVEPIPGMVEHCKKHWGLLLSTEELAEEVKKNPQKASDADQPSI